MLTVKEMNDWLTINDLDLEEFQYLMSANLRLNFLVIKNNVDILTIYDNPGHVWWLRDALWLSGLYGAAKKSLLMIRDENEYEKPLRDDETLKNIFTSIFDIDIA